MKTICFLGDSITRRGYWIAEIFDHLRKNGTVVYNCGVSGDADEAVEALLVGQVAYNPCVRCGHHDHESGHACGDHGCGSHSCHYPKRYYRDKHQTL